MLNSCVQTAADNWQWRHFHGYSFTYCVFISSGQASMKRPLWIKLLLWSRWPCRQLSAAPPCFLLPQQVHIKSRTKKKKKSEKWNFQSVGSLGYCFENVLLLKLQNATQVKQDTPEHCTYLTCVHNAFLVEIWLGCTSNHFTIPGSNMTHWYSGDGPKKKKSQTVVTLNCKLSHIVRRTRTTQESTDTIVEMETGMFSCVQKKKKKVHRRLIKSKRCHESLGASVSLISP